MTAVYSWSILRFISTLFGAALFSGQPAHSWNAQAFSFLKEEVTFTICAPDTIEVQGKYWFINRNDDSVSTSIFYPFPLGVNSCFPHRIAVNRFNKPKAVPFHSMPDGIGWRLDLSAHSVDSVCVEYRQRVKRGVGEYIVSTTKLWKLPLQKADFKIRVPTFMTLSYWSFMADSLYTSGDTVTYYAHFDSFFPDSEMVVRWHW